MIPGQKFTLAYKDFYVEPLGGVGQENDYREHINSEESETFTFKGADSNFDAIIVSEKTGRVYRIPSTMRIHVNEGLVTN